MLISNELISFTPVLFGVNNLPVNDFTFINQTLLYSKTLGIEIKISKSNFLYILKNANIKKSQIEEYAVISVFENKCYLFIEGTEEYDACLNNNRKKLILKKNTYFSVFFKKGYLFEEESIVNALYIGKVSYLDLEIRKPWKLIHILSKAENNHLFYIEDTDSFVLVERKKFSLLQELEKGNFPDFQEFQNKEEIESFKESLKTKEPKKFFRYFYYGTFDVSIKQNLKKWVSEFSDFEVV